MQIERERLLKTSGQKAKLPTSKRGQGISVRATDGGRCPIKTHLRVTTWLGCM